MSKEDKKSLIEDMNGKKPSRFSKKIVVCSVCAILLFFAAETYLLHVGAESYPDVFIAAWFSFWGVELFNLSRIKINEDKLNNPYSDLSKLRSGKDGEDDEDRGKAVG